eukprot:4543483-Amphidinium_carterae.1
MASARAMVQQNCQLFALKGKKRGRPFSMAPTPQPSTQTLIPPAKRQLVKPDGRHLSEQADHGSGVDTQQRRPLSASQGLAASLRGCPRLWIVGPLQSINHINDSADQQLLELLR